MPNFQLNLNGDAPRRIRDEFIAVMQAARALDAALAALSAVHGRNYQTLPNPAEALKADCEARNEARRKAMETYGWAEEGAMRVLAQERPR